MRTISGEIVLPEGIPTTKARVLLEVRDVTYADAPSLVVASQKLSNVHLEPGGRIPFSLQVPEADPSCSLSVRVHVKLATSKAITSSSRVYKGDLLTTAHFELPAKGDCSSLKIKVSQI